jgi:adenosylcobinamide-phosphate synthase
MSFLTAFVALIIDRFVPWSDQLTAKIGHPVIWQGKLITFLDILWNCATISATKRRYFGALMLLILLGVTLAASLFILWLIGFLPFSWAVEALLASVFLAHNSLYKAVLSVASALDISLEKARIAVSHIVGRDTQELDKHEVSRAAIESLAENSSDGIIAPLFWLALLGLPGIALYKAINTADSMVGHKSEKYLEFGWASAKLDDVVNWIPARLTAIFYALAARYDIDKSMKKSWYVAKRDAPKHVSPNAGWPEAAMAGALDFGLGGSRAYGGKTLDLPAMGEGRRDLDAADILRALRLFSIMTTMALALTGVLAAIQFYL